MNSYFITTTAKDTPQYPWAHANYIRVLRAAELAAGSNYTIADHPKDADVILFIEPRRPYQNDIRLSPLYKEYPHKSRVLDFLDNPTPMIPGVYVGLRRDQVEGEKFQGGFYLRVADNKYLTSTSGVNVNPDLLFSFVGKVENYPDVRQKILQLVHPMAVLKNRSSNQSENDSEYIEILKHSKFVLAPRGIGPSSWRLFETMRAGRVPVIISDAWVPPGGVAWQDFSVRVPENNINEIPSILESIEPRSKEMGLAARREWERCFSYENSFSWIAARINICNEYCDKNSYDPHGSFRNSLNYRQLIGCAKENILVRFGLR